MTEAERLTEAQMALAQMRDDLREKAPNVATDAAQYLLAALKRRGLRLVSDDEWEDQFDQGFEEGKAVPDPRLEEALLDPFVTR